MPSLANFLAKVISPTQEPLKYQNTKAHGILTRYRAQIFTGKQFTYYNIRFISQTILFPALIFRCIPIVTIKVLFYLRILKKYTTTTTTTANIMATAKTTQA